MERKWAFALSVSVCFIIFLITFMKFTVKEKAKVHVKPYKIPQLKSTSNNIIRFVQLPPTFAHTGNMLVKGESSPKHIKIIIHGPGDLISDNIRRNVVWEGPYIDILTDYLRRHPNLHFIDIGCNIGLYTLSVASLRPDKRQILAVDANEQNCQFVGKSLQMNGYSEQVTIINNALDEERREATLYVVPSNVGGSYVPGKNDTGRSHTGFIATKINSVLLDDLLELVTFRQAVMKMDIEGSENRALRKAEKFFREMKITAVMFEWHAGVRRPKDLAEELIAFFTRYGFVPYTLLSENRQLLSVANYGTWPGDIVWMLKDYNHTYSL